MTGSIYITFATFHTRKIIKNKETNEKSLVVRGGVYGHWKRGMYEQGKRGQLVAI